LKTEKTHCGIERANELILAKFQASLKLAELAEHATLTHAKEDD